MTLDSDSGGTRIAKSSCGAWFCLMALRSTALAIISVSVYIGKGIGKGLFTYSIRRLQIANSSDLQAPGCHSHVVCGRNCVSHDCVT